MAATTTTTDAGADTWLLDDEVVHLREWGTTRIHALPPPGESSTIGAAESCGLRLVDPSGRVSREHARLSFAHDRWHILDLGSKNGVRLDGARRMAFPIAPGIEIGIGGITLVVESRRSIALQGFLARLLGWAPGRIATVDLGLRAVRTAATRRASLVVSGDGELVRIAHALHRHALGADKPFVVCDPRRRRTEANVRSAASQTSGLEAIGLATGGTVCVAANRLPRDFVETALALRDPETRVQLAVCTAGPPPARPLPGDPIVVPALRERPGEIDRIIDEYATEAIADLGAAPASYSPRDRDWVRTHAAGTIPEIEKATRRLVAIREHGTLVHAAARLEMSHVALSRWFTRRRRLR